MNQEIGFIGLGSLGTPIALNLLESGHRLHIYNRTYSKTALLTEKGAIAHREISELAVKADVIFSIVSNDSALCEVVENGLKRGLRKGGIHISMSTISPKTAGDLSIAHGQRGQTYIAAPVFGRPEAASARKLNFVVAGSREAVNKIEPLLRDAGGAGIWNFGEDCQAANTVKLCGNFLIASALESIGESIKLATRSGVDAQKMWEMLSQTLFNTPVYHNYSRIILQKQFEPAAFTARLGLKDLNLVLDLGESVGQPMPLARLLQKNMSTLVDAGLSEIDWSAISQVEMAKHPMP